MRWNEVRDTQTWANVNVTSKSVLWSTKKCDGWSVLFTRALHESRQLSPLPRRSFPGRISGTEASSTRPFFIASLCQVCMTSHIIRPWRNTKLLSLILPQKFEIQSWRCHCPRYLCLFHIVFECTPSIHDQGKMLVLPNHSFYWVLSTSDQDCVSFQPIWCHPHTQIRITFFHGVRKDIPNWKLSPNRVPEGFSQVASPIIGLPKDDHTDFAQEERLGLRCCTMILAICVVVDESKYLDIPIIDFFLMTERLPFWPGFQQILHVRLVLRILVALQWRPSLLLPPFGVLMILAQWMLHKNQNHLLRCRLGVQLVHRVSEILVPNPHFSYDKDPLTTESVWSFLLSLLRRSHLFCFLVNLLPDHFFPSVGFSSNRVNWGNPVQGSDKSLDPSTFQ